MENGYDQKLKVFSDKNLPIHIKTKKDSWINGYIIEIGSIFCIVEEFKLGRTIIFFDEISELDVYKKEGDDGTT